ncbi:hypothetical protein GCM10022247_72700 [Allokutzneria multivorans]|uniref:Uncharacterized protein n=1 Tax=Allokutzneria multivorans TaxID=1142134 RepID=A0ABP7U5G1_9PSEU
MKQVRITVKGDDAAAELRSLLAWLLREDDLETPRLAPAVPAEGEMGALADTILLMVTSSGTATLTMAVRTWLRQRRSNVEVTIRSSEGEETTLKIEGLPATGAVSFAHRVIDRTEGGIERTDGAAE